MKGFLEIFNEKIELPLAFFYIVLVTDRGFSRILSSRVSSTIKCVLDWINEGAHPERLMAVKIRNRKREPQRKLVTERSTMSGEYHET